MDNWDYLIWAASLGFSVSLVPQFLRTLRRRRADDLSVPFLLLVLLSSSCALPYFVNRGEYAFAAAQAVNLGVWATVLYFRLRPGVAPPPQA